MFVLFNVLLFSVFGQEITVIGIGRLGLPFALCLEKAGYNVLGVDVSEDYVFQMNSKTYISPEPFVAEYLKSSTNFKATTSLKEGLEFSDIYFIFVPTNSIPGLNTYDHGIVTSILEKMNSFRLTGKHIVICSTVFPGYIRDVARHLLTDCVDVTINYNPEFIAQGNIIHGLTNPDIILIGEDNVDAGNYLSSIYHNLCFNEPYFARMSVDSAELAKLALNCFVTAKIAFANLVGDIADQTPGADKFAILKALGMDQRIGSKCLCPGYGFGGPCFPRDNRAMANYVQTRGIDPLFFVATDQINQAHARFMADQFLSLDLEEYVFEDMCYKSNCPVPIIECSQKLEVAKMIALSGKKVIIRDRDEVVLQIKEKYPSLFDYQEL